MATSRSFHRTALGMVERSHDTVVRWGVDVRVYRPGGVGDKSRCVRSGG